MGKADSLTPLQKRYVALHRAAIRRRLAAEQLTHKRLVATLLREQHLARATIVAAASSQQHAMRPGGVVLVAQQTAAAMAAALSHEVLAGRQEARGIAQRQVHDEIVLALDVLRKDGYAVPRARDTSVLAGAAGSAVLLSGLDQVKAKLVGESVTNEWLRATLAEATSWERSGLIPQDLSQWIRQNKARIETRARLIGTTETFDAFEDEVDREIHRFFVEEHGEEEWSHNVYHVWSAVMDRATCSACWQLDGKVKPIAQSLGASPPLHPRCRCFILTFAVPKDLRKKLPGIATDYRRLKGDFGERPDENYPVEEFIGQALRTTSPQTALAKLREREQRHMAR